MKKKQSSKAIGEVTPVITPKALEQTRTALRHLCSLANAAMGVSRDDIQAGEDFDALHVRIEVLKVLVDRMGWVADVGLRRLGGSGTFSSAEDWMLPGA